MCGGSFWLVAAGCMHHKREKTDGKSKREYKRGGGRNLENVLGDVVNMLMLG